MISDFEELLFEVGAPLDSDRDKRVLVVAFSGRGDVGG